MVKFTKYIFISLLLSIPVFGDDYHNIQNFYGERATGMGGTFAAISDDASGAFYNPGGLAFAKLSQFSINVSSYNNSKQQYKDLFGPGQSYERTTKNYIPSFMGVTKKYDNLVIGFSVLNTINSSYDQSNRIILPRYRTNLSQIDMSYNRENFQMMGGPSISYLFGTKFSVGLTTYALYDTYKLASSEIDTAITGSVTTTQQQVRRTSGGGVPIFGIKYKPIENLSIGLSAKKLFSATGKIGTLDNVTNAGQTGSPTSLVSQGSNEMLAKSGGNLPIIANGLNSKIPETAEIRLGLAYTLFDRLTLAVDGVYTSGWKDPKNQNSYNMNTRIYTYQDRSKSDSERAETYNYSVGGEFYITPSIVIRFGHFSNRSNSKHVSWNDAAVVSYIRNQLGAPESQNQTNIQFQNVIYSLPEYRAINANLLGYSIGLGYESDTSTMNIAVVSQKGRGVGVGDKYQLPSLAVLNDTTVYLSGGTKFK